MNQNEFLQDEGAGLPRVVVAGVGGCGCRAVQVMAERGIADAHFACADADFQELRRSPAETHLPLGEKLAGGLGAGGDPRIGREAAMESIQSIGEAFKDAELAIVVCGLGGGAGTGAAPVVARAAREAGALVAVLAVMPFEFEGAERVGIARSGLAELAREADCVFPMPNDRLLASASSGTPLKEFMRKALDGLFFCAKDISSLETAPRHICLDPADVRTCMAGTGLGAVGMGRGSGRMRARDAVQQALADILQDGAAIGSAKSVTYVMTAPEDISGEEMEEIGEIIREPLSSGTNIVYSIVFDSALEDGGEIRVTVIVAGSRQQEQAS